VFAAAFVFLLGSVGAVGLGQFTARAVGAWISIGYSLGAVICTVAAVAMRSDR
jgi:hypothetical protein